MKKVKIIIALLVVLLVGNISTPTLACTNANQKCSAMEQKIKKRYKKVKFYPSGKKCWKAIKNRKGKSYYIVEKLPGTVTNKKGDGKTKDGYISYRHLRNKNIKKGAKVVSYLVYSKNNNSCDDVIARYDVIIRR